jgi:hypothetical protein
MELEQVVELLEGKLRELQEDTKVRIFEGGSFRAWAQSVDAILIS